MNGLIAISALGMDDLLLETGTDIIMKYLLSTNIIGFQFIKK